MCLIDRLFKDQSENGVNLNGRPTNEAHFTLDTILKDALEVLPKIADNEDMNSTIRMDLSSVKEGNSLLFNDRP